MKTSIVRWSIAALVVAALILGIGVSAYAQDPLLPTPIPTQENARPVPPFIGHEATPNPITSRPIPPNSPSQEFPLPAVMGPD